MKPRGGEGQNGRLKCPTGFLVLSDIQGKATKSYEFLLTFIRKRFAVTYRLIDSFSDWILLFLKEKMT